MYLCSGYYAEQFIVIFAGQPYWALLLHSCAHALPVNSIYYAEKIMQHRLAFPLFSFKCTPMQSDQLTYSPNVSHELITLPLPVSERNAI